MHLNTILSSAKRPRILCGINEPRVHLFTAICVIAEISCDSVLLYLAACYRLRGKGGIRACFMVKRGFVYVEDIR